MEKIKTEDLIKLNDEKLKKILKKEGNSIVDPSLCDYYAEGFEIKKVTPFDKWWHLFELMSRCRKLEFSELETYCIVGNRFKISFRENGKD